MKKTITIAIPEGLEPVVVSCLFEDFAAVYEPAANVISLTVNEGADEATCICRSFAVIFGRRWSGEFH